MLRVGLTGNIAAGKSSVARRWRERGATVVDADALARRATEPGTPALRQIAAAWGPEVLDAEGRLDRGALRRIAFADPEARARLEAIVHPEVRRLREAEHRAARERGERMVVDDVPLLFEAGMEDEFDVLVLVDAPEAVRRDRLVGDRGLEAAEAERMISSQMPVERKRARADHVIPSTGSVAALERAADRVWDRLLARAREGSDD